MRLTAKDKEIITACIDSGKALPEHYKALLFNTEDVEYVEATKDYKLVYKGKARKEDIIANTPAAPLQKIRSFNSDNPFEDSWQNMLIFGDNLLALKAIYEDQRGPNTLKTKNRIKLIYIDPPFATKQDFMKDREKAYRDKIISTHFVEFLRRRLVLMHQILARDGFIFVHMDAKKVHYVKTVMDEVFGETCFRNEIILPRPFTKNLQQQFSYLNSLNTKHDTLLFYAKSPDTSFPLLWVDKETIKHPDGHWHHFWSTADRPTMRYQLFGITPTTGQWIWKESKARQAVKNYEKFLQEASGRSLVQYWHDTGRTLRFIRQDDDGKPQSWRPPASQQLADTLWLNIMTYENRKDYPTQKHEDLLERLILAFSDPQAMVLDAFVGSGTTLSVAEKCHRRWIGIDCGKLAMYTVQKRMLNLTTRIGSSHTDQRRDYERLVDFAAHSKNSRGLFFVFEKARKGDLLITDTFLKTLAKIVEANLSGTSTEAFSLICPDDKFKIDKLKVEDNENGKAGEKIVKVGRVNFCISFVQPKNRPEEEKPLNAKEFSLYHAGTYDQDLILNLDWDNYHSFVAKLFDVRLEKRKIYGFGVDGTIGTYPAYIWPYPNHKGQHFDKDSVKDLHKSLGGRAGEKLYVIAPTISVSFMEDEVQQGRTTYVFLKVPISVLNALIKNGEAGSLKQPVSESEVNEVIDAVGYDFISQPVVQANYKRLKPLDRTLLNQKKNDFVIEIKEFKSNTLVYDPEDFENFETLSMVMIDTDYNDDYFSLSMVFWADTIIDNAKKKAFIRIAQDDFTGKMMIIFMDHYGNELKIVKTKRDFK